MSRAREQPPVERIVRPFQDFAHKQSSGGILLIIATVVALVWVNSPWAESYAALWHTKLTVGVGDFSISKDLNHWINDGLMAVFFLVVGLEIKREIFVGELSFIRSPTLLVAANLIGVGKTLVYAVLGIGLWLCFLLSGVHATIAGVLLALTVPASSFINPTAFLERGRYILVRFEKAGEKGENVLTNEERQAALHALNDAAYKLEPPLHELEHALHPWVVFAIMPVFALANAGLPLGGGIGEALTSPVAYGIVVGLVVGKQLGITMFAWLAVRSGISELPGGINWRHVYGAGWLAGIGFTMSLFITDLAFSDSSLVDAAKLGILVASLTAGVVGWTILRAASSPS